MAATTYSVQIDQDKDGTWDAANDDLTAYVRGPINTGLGFRDPIGHIAQLGNCSIILDNTDLRFSPDNGGSPYAGTELKGLPIRVQATSGSTWTVWSGFIERMHVEAGRGGLRSARLDCEDMLGKLSRANVKLPLQEKKTQSELYKMIGSEAFRTLPATGTVTFTANVSDGDRLCIGDSSFTFVTVLVNAYDVLIGDTKEDTARNLTAAILDDADAAGAGVQVYGTNTLRSEQFTASRVDEVVTIQAKARGTGGNAIEMATSLAHYHADSMIADVGAIVSGTLADTYTQNGAFLELSEVAGTPAFTYRFNFSIGAGNQPIKLFIFGRYEGNVGHTVNVEFVDPVLGPPNYTNLGTLVSSSNNVLHTFVFGGNGATAFGAMTIRINHTTAGNINHGLFIDHLYVTTDTGGDVDEIDITGMSGGVDGPVGLFSYDDGNRTFDVAANDWDDLYTSAFRAMRDVAESEFGYIYVSRAGILTAWDKDFEFELPSSTPAITINNTHAGQVGEYGGQVFNRSVVTFSPRGTTAEQVIARANNVIEVPGSGVATATRWENTTGYPYSGGDGGTSTDELGPGVVTARLPFVESDTGNIVGAKEVITPRRSTDYTVNDARDGTGFDYTNAYPICISVSMVVTGSGVEITFQNTATGPLYVFGLQVRGTAIIAYDDQQIIRESSASMAAYDMRKRDYNLPLTSGETYAESIAMYLVSRYMDPHFIISSVTVDANRTIGGVHPQSIEIGSLITLSETQTATSAKSYYVRGIDTAIESGGQKASLTWHLKRLDDFTAWILGIPAFSTLGYTTRPGL